ncbi:MAG: DNA-binding protein [Klebsiella pneumoniae]|nr:DNA-binding protein [Klebsiella pneumoniae]
MNNNQQSASFFITTERHGRQVRNLREFSDANPDICHKAVNGQPYMIDPRALELVPNWNCREMGLGEEYYKLPKPAAHIQNLKNAFINGADIDPITVVIVDGRPREEWHSLDGAKALLLCPVGRGIAYSRLVNEAGMSVEQVSKRENISDMAVRQLISLATINDELKVLISQDVISYTLCLELIRDLGENEALEKIRSDLNDKIKVLSPDLSGVGSLPLNVTDIIKATTGTRKAVRITKSSIGIQPIPRKLSQNLAASIKEVSNRLRASLPTEIDLEQIGQNEKINIEVDRHFVELILQAYASIRDHETKLERKTTKGKLSQSTQSTADDTNITPASNAPLNEPPSNNQNNEFSLLNLHSAV